MSSKFQKDLSRGDRLTEFVYSTILLGDDGLALDESQVRCIGFDSDPEAQYAGIDLIVSQDGGETTIDVKSAVDYAGVHSESKKPLGTFVQEISYINGKGEERDGWFVDRGKRTDVYAFCWIPKVTGEVAQANKWGYCRVQDENDAVEIHVAMIRSDKLKDMVYEAIGEELGCTAREDLEDKLKEAAGKLRASEVKSLTYSDGYRLHLSDPKPDEKPVNLLVPKRAIMDAANYAYKAIRSQASPDIRWSVVRW